MMDSTIKRIQTNSSRVHTLGPKNNISRNTKTPRQFAKEYSNIQHFSVNQAFISGGCTSIFGPIKISDGSTSISLSENNAALVISQLNQLKNKYTQLETQLAKTCCIEGQMLKNVVNQTRKFQTKMNNIVIQSEVQIGNKQVKLDIIQNLENKLISQQEKQEKKRQLIEQKEKERVERQRQRAQKKQRKKQQYEIKRKEVIQTLEVSSQKIQTLQSSNKILVDEIQKTSKEQKQLDISIEILKSRILKMQTQNELVIRTIRQQIGNFSVITKK